MRASQPVTRNMKPVQVTKGSSSPYLADKQAQPQGHQVPLESCKLLPPNRKRLSAGHIGTHSKSLPYWSQTTTRSMSQGQRPEVCSRCRQGLAPSEASRGRFFPASYWLLVGAVSPRFPPNPPTSLPSPPPSSPCVSLCLVLFLKGHWSYWIWGPPDSSTISSHLMTSATTPAPNSAVL